MHRRVARRSDGAFVSRLRTLVEQMMSVLHSENHDMATNGEFTLIKRLAEHLDIVVDVGANRGMWTREVCRAGACGSGDLLRGRLADA